MKARLTFLAVVLLCLLFSSVENSHGSPEQPPVLAICDIVPTDHRRFDDPGVLALRDRVVSELLEKYSCYVLNRSYGYAFAVEDLIHRISSLEASAEGSQGLPAADYVIEGTMSFETIGESVRGIIWYVDLRDASATPQSKPLKFSASSTHEAPGIIAQKIGELLSLPPRASNHSATFEKEPANLIWCVLPFSRIDLGKEDPDQLSMHVESMLQENKVVGKLVDREAIDAVLNELKLKSVMKVNEHLAGKIARLVGADRVLTGVTTKAAQGLRIDVHAVDARSGVVLSAAQAVCRSKTELRETAGGLCVELVKNASTPPQVRASTASQRRREAEFYVKNAWGYPRRGTLSITYATNARVVDHYEAAYMLVHDDPKWSYLIGKKLAEYLVEYDLFQGSNLEAAQLVERLLSSVEHSAETPAPLLLRAGTQEHRNNYAKALRLVEKHLERYPNVEICRAKHIVAKCYFGLGDLDKAWAILQSLRSDYSDKMDHKLRREVEWLTAKVVPKKGDFELLRREVERRPQVLRSTKDAYDYLKLFQEHEGPEKTLEHINWLRTRRPLGVHQLVFLASGGRCNLALGRHMEAARCCEAFLIGFNQYPMRCSFSYPDWGKSVRNMLSEIKNKLGKVPKFFKFGGEVREFPQNRSIYIVPVGDVYSEIVKEAANKVGKILGTKVGVLEGIPIPQEAVVEDGSELLYEPLWNELLKHSQIPEDAVFVVFITGESLTSYPRDAYSKHEKNPVILSYRRMMGHGNLMDSIWYASGRLTRAIVECLCHQRIPRCDNFPCLFGRYGDPNHWAGCHAFCPECQERYKKMDFEQIHRDLMSYLKGAGVKIVSKNNP